MAKTKTKTKHPPGVLDCREGPLDISVRVPLADVRRFRKEQARMNLNGNNAAVALSLLRGGLDAAEARAAREGGGNG